MSRQKIYTIIILFLCVLVLPIKSYANSKNDIIYKNIYIEGIDVSGLTKQEAIDKVMSKLYKNQKVNFLYNEMQFPLKFNEIELNYNVDEVVDKAYNVGKNKNLLKNTKMKFNLNMGNKIIFKLKAKYNLNKINEYIENINTKIRKEPVNATINIENNRIKINNEENGIMVDRDKLNKLIISKIEDIKFDQENIPIKTIRPKYTYEKLSKLNSVLGTYETKFNTSNYNRSNNIFIATTKTNNILLDTQEEFSFNKMTGKRNVEQGFKEAPIIINGELKNGVGGGICQVSSTIYNAALYSGLEIIQARNHSIPSAYIQKGRDATVSYGSVDLRFKNIYKYPVLIQNKIVNDKIVTTIYGNNSCKKQIDIITEVIDVIPNKVVVKTNNDMYEGEKYIKEKGRKGYKVKTYRIYKNENKEILSKEFINESYYPPMNKIIIKGIKARNKGISI